MPLELTELRPSEGIRWAIGEATSRRSSTYRFWGNKKGDFYLAARSLGASLKTSLHRDGRCHTGLTSDYAAKQGVSERHMDRWTVPLDRTAKAIQVVVAERDLAVYPADDKKPMRWVRAPRPGHIAIVGIVVLPTSNAREFGDSWPGADVGTEPVGIIVTKVRTAFVLHWENRLTAAQDSELRTLRTRLAADASQQGIVPAAGLRVVVIGQLGDGDAATRTLFDISYQAT